jgi:hypothetical protein
MIFPSPDNIVNFDVSKGKFEPLDSYVTVFSLYVPLAKEKVPCMCFTRYSVHGQGQRRIEFMLSLWISFYCKFVARGPW